MTIEFTYFFVGKKEFTVELTKMDNYNISFRKKIKGITT